MGRRAAFLGFIGAFLFLSLAVFGEDRLVPSEYATIQAAIDDCNNGDVVIVEPNTYTGSGNRDLDFGGRAITVRSIDPEDPCVVAATVIDCQNSGRGFIFNSGEDPNSVVWGFTITNGYNGDTGGAIFCSGTSPMIRNLTITGNEAQWAGGGISCFSGSAPTISNCSIISNQTDGGGGIFCRNSDPIINGCTISGNTASNEGGGIHLFLGSSPTIINCEVSDNAADTGGAFYTYNGDQSITNCIIVNNTADASGGAFYTYSGDQSITNCIIVNNTADASGNTPDASGGAFYYYNGNPTITNCTVVNNSAGWVFSAGGIFCDSQGNANPTITNCILWGNGNDLYGCSATYSCIEDGDAGVGNISADPCFVSGPYGDYYLSQIAAGQAVDSPCVDAGSDTAANLEIDIFTTRTDHIGDAGTVDMGYHYMSNPADIDGDGDVDFVDFAILASQWKQAPGVPSADIAPPGGDNVVDGLDLELLVHYWLWEKQ